MPNPERHPIERVFDLIANTLVEISVPNGVDVVAVSVQATDSEETIPLKLAQSSMVGQGSVYAYRFIGEHNMYTVRAIIEFAPAEGFRPLGQCKISIK